MVSSINSYEAYVLNLVFASTLLLSTGLALSMSRVRTSQLLKHNMLCIVLVLCLLSTLMILVAGRKGLGFWGMTRAPRNSGPTVVVETFREKDLPSAERKLWVEEENSAMPVAAGTPVYSPIGRDEANPNNASSRHWLDWTYVVGVTWICITLCQAARVLVACWGLSRICRKLERASDVNLARIARATFASNGLPADTPIYESSELTAPSTLGIFHPVIALPTGFAESLTDAELHAVLAHEAAHVFRRDSSIALLQQVTRAAFWWNPLLMIVNRKIDRFREQLCDDRAIHFGASRNALASAIVRVAGWAVSKTSSCTLSPSVLGGVDDLECRILRLRSSARSVPRWSRMSSVFLVFFTICLSLVASIPVLQAQDPQGKNATTFSGDPPPNLEAAINWATESKITSYHLFLRNASLWLAPKCLDLSPKELEKVMHQHEFALKRKWNSGDQQHRCYVLKKNAFRLSETQAMDLVLRYSTAKEPSTENIVSAIVALEIVPNESFALVRRTIRFPDDTILDTVLKEKELEFVGGQWPLLKSISVSYGEFIYQELTSSGFNVILEYAASAEEKIGGLKIYLHSQSGLDPVKFHDPEWPKQDFVRTDSIGKLRGNGSNEWWHGSPEVVKANKKKYLAYPSSQSFGIADGGANWSSNVDDPVPGIDFASVTVTTLIAGPEEGVTFVVWSDLPNGRGGDGGSEVRTKSAQYRGYHTRSPDGKRLEFNAETKDGVSGSLTIAGVQYPFTNGALFLVSAKERKPIVQQLNVDVRRFPRYTNGILQYAHRSKEIRDFFQKQKQSD